MSFPKLYFKILIFLCISVSALLTVLYNVNVSQLHINANTAVQKCKRSKVDFLNYEKYLIQTPTCAIERIPLFTPETAHMFGRYENREYECPPDDGSSAIKRVNFTWIQVPVEGCVAREIVRDGANEGGMYGKTFNFGNQTVMNFPTSDAVIVACRNFQLQRIVPLIPYKEPFFSNNSSRKLFKNFKNRPNILAIGIDSISRLNFLRHFTETKKFLDKNSFEGSFYGLHKIGDNTWPNLIGMLTGLDMAEVEKLIPDSRQLDGLPLIFKEFSAAGYLNTFLEDMPNFALFTFHWKNGFIKQPTEYWLRPVNLLMSRGMERYVCYKEKLEIEHYFDYLLDQMLAFRERNQNFLNFMHLATLTHDYLNHAQYADQPILRFLKRIFEHQIDKDTVILFYSDHGLRIGPILLTESGYHESRLPFMYLSIPKTLKLKDENGKLIDNVRIREALKTNARRLTSQFDVHATLKHLLNEAPPTEERYGKSLFTPIPINRTCPEAGIPDEFCLCNPLSELTHTESISTLANFIVDYLNFKLEKYADKCVKLKLGTVLKAKIAADLAVNSKPKRRQFLLRITTLPGNGNVEMALSALADKNGLIVDKKTIKTVSDVLRLDQYWQQSMCVSNTAVENICYCKNLIK